MYQELYDYLPQSRKGRKGRKGRKEKHSETIPIQVLFSI
jgi:hypothetical protein